MDQKKLEELIKDEAFVKKLAELKTEEQIQAALKEEGLDISIDEIKELTSEGQKVLSNGELETISGGDINFDEVARKATAAWDVTKGMAKDAWQKTPVNWMIQDTKGLMENLGADRPETAKVYAKSVVTDAMGIAFVVGGAWLVHKTYKAVKKLVSD